MPNRCCKVSTDFWSWHFFVCKLLTSSLYSDRASFLFLLFSFWQACFHPLAMPWISAITAFLRSTCSTLSSITRVAFLAMYCSRRTCLLKSLFSRSSFLDRTALEHASCLSCVHEFFFGQCGDSHTFMCIPSYFLFVNPCSGPPCSSFFVTSLSLDLWHVLSSLPSVFEPVLCVSDSNYFCIYELLTCVCVLLPHIVFFKHIYEPLTCAIFWSCLSWWLRCPLRLLCVRARVTVVDLKIAWRPAGRDAKVLTNKSMSSTWTDCANSRHWALLLCSVCQIEIKKKIIKQNTC